MAEGPQSSQVSLLRGINVGGHALISMATLRDLYQGMGLTEVRTHLQSGNVLFSSDRDPAAIAREAETAILAALGLTVRILGRSHSDLARIVGHDPFPDADPARHLVVFLSGEPAADVVARVTATARSGEELVVRGRELHIHYPDGIGTSRLSTAALERSGIVATARNWRTVSRLHELSAPPA